MRTMKLSCRSDSLISKLGRSAGSRTGVTSTPGPCKQLHSIKCHVLCFAVQIRSEPRPALSQSNDRLHFIRLALSTASLCYKMLPMFSAGCALASPCSPLRTRDQRGAHFTKDADCLSFVLTRLDGLTLPMPQSMLARLLDPSVLSSPSSLLSHRKPQPHLQNWFAGGPLN